MTPARLLLSTTALATVALLLLLGMGPKFPPLAEQMILYLPEPGCAPYTPEGGVEMQPTYGVEMDQGEGWAPIAWGVNVLQTIDCIAFARMEPKFRACCSAGTESACSEEATHDTERPHCVRIFALMSGRQYQQDAVDEWNAEPASTPTPIPPPLPTTAPEPTAQPLPTLLPYLGACCYDLAKPWSCGLATEPTCQTQGGVRWTRQAPCSNELCSP